MTTATTLPGKTTFSSACAVKLRSMFVDVRCAKTDVKQEVQSA